MKQKLLVFLLPSAFFSFALAQVSPIAPPIPTVPSGAILNQLNEQNRPETFNQVAPISDDVVTFEGLKFVGSNPDIIAAANEFQRADIGQKLSISAFITKLNHWIQTEKHFPITFVKQKDGSYTYIDQVIYEGADIHNNSNLREEIIRGVINYGVEQGKPIDVAQLERNTTIQNELPGVIGQFGMLPGSATGATRLNDHIGNGDRVTGYVGVNNEGMQQTGTWQATGGLNLNNLLGQGEHFAINAQVADHSEYGSVTADTIVHSSGTRLSVNASTYQYKYDLYSASNAGLTSNTSNMTGISNAYWSELTQPMVRNAQNKINGILGYAYKTNIANSNVVAFTAPYVDSLGQLQPGGTASQYFNLNNNIINEQYVEVNGTSGTQIGRVSYDVKLTNGSARQTLGNIYSIDQQGPNAYGGTFQKVNLQAQFTSLAIPPIWDSAITASTSMQFSNRNLVTAEQQYVGGAYQMRAWSPQIIGGAQVIWGELGIEKWLTPNISLKPFLEAASVTTNINNYSQITNGASVNSGNGNTNFMADTGLTIVYSQPEDGLYLTGSVAAKLSNNPSQFGVQVVDHASVRGWIRAQWFFK